MYAWSSVSQLIAPSPLATTLVSKPVHKNLLKSHHFEELYIHLIQKIFGIWTVCGSVERGRERKILRNKEDGSMLHIYI
jgi:hypothetical protein